jgi:hypothetical protein
MNPRRNPCVQAVAAVLDERGIPRRVELRGSGHVRIIFARTFVTVPASPSCWRAHHNARADVRRRLRAA